MNEFDLRKFLYNNPLLESEAKLKAKKKELEKKEDKLDSIDMKDEDAKEKAAHHKGAIKNVKKDIKKNIVFVAQGGNHPALFSKKIIVNMEKIMTYIQPSL